MPESQPLVAPIDVFRFLREETKHEYNVLGSRLTSYITSQSFLFTTYGVSMQNQNTHWGVQFRLIFPLIVCSVGILTSLRAQPGVASAVKLINHLHDRQAELHNDPYVKALDPTDQKWMIEVHAKSLRFSLGAAYVFGLAWVALLPLAFYVYWRT